jgi:predicted O-methyltransferase YrrM
MNFIKSKFNQLILVWDFLKFFSKAKTVDTLDSPALFSFYQNVIYNNNEDIRKFESLEQVRNKLLADIRSVDESALGAGSKMAKKGRRKVKDIAQSALSNSYKCRLLYRITEYYQASYILELGTSLGMASQYLASSKHCIELTTIEGSQSISKIASEYNTQPNIIFINSDFDKALAVARNENKRYDLIIIDGDHTFEAVMINYQHCQVLLNPNGVIIVDDIYWSKGMKKAWKEIQNKTEGDLLIDLFYFGIIVNNKNIKVKRTVKIIPYQLRWKLGLFR